MAPPRREKRGKKWLGKEGIFDNIVLNWHIVTKWFYSDYMQIYENPKTRKDFFNNSSFAFLFSFFW